MCLKQAGLIIMLLPAMFFFQSCNNNNDTNQQRPNILIAIADDISYPHWGIYGTSWVKTPTIDRIAGSGILFTNAYTPNAKCSPSRACLLTGRNSWQLGEAANHVPFFPAEYKTFMELLKENGYHTGFTAKGWSPGNPGTVNGKRRELTGKNYSKIRTDPPATGISDIDYAANFEAFLDEWDKDQPFCFWYGALEPHRGYEYGSGVAKGGYTIDSVKKVFPFWPDTLIVKNDLLDYAYEINHFDIHLGRIINSLDEKGLLENTLVIVTADNGMPFPRIKGQAYELSNHMPLAIMWKGKIRGQGLSNNSLVSFIDIAPTILEAACISGEDNTMQKIEGRSLMPVIENPEKSSGNDCILIGKERHDVGRPDDQGYPIRGIVSDNYIYLVNFKPGRWPAGNPETGYLNCDASPTKSLILEMRRQNINTFFWDNNFGLRPEEELYDIKSDPYCMNNLAYEQSLDETKQELRKKLFDKLAEQDDPRIKGEGDIFDHYVYSAEKHRDFYNKFMKGELKPEDAVWVVPSDFEKNTVGK